MSSSRCFDIIAFFSFLVDKRSIDLEPRIKKISVIFEDLGLVRARAQLPDIFNTAYTCRKDSHCSLGKIL